MSTTQVETSNILDYTEYDQDHKYTHDNGLVVLPVAGRTAKHRVIRLHGGYGMRKVKWKARRLGVPPMLPTAADTEGDTLLSTTITPSLPRANLSGPGYDWTVTGEYVFVQNYPRVPGTNVFPVGSYPFPVQPAADYAREVAKPYLNTYYVQPSTDKFETLFNKLAQVTTAQESPFWPFLALPSTFFRDYIIGG